MRELLSTPGLKQTSNPFPGLVLLPEMGPWNVSNHDPVQTTNSPLVSPGLFLMPEKGGLLEE